MTILVQVTSAAAAAAAALVATTRNKQRQRKATVPVAFGHIPAHAHEPRDKFIDAQEATGVCIQDVEKLRTSASQDYGKNNHNSSRNTAAVPVLVAMADVKPIARTLPLVVGVVVAVAGPQAKDRVGRHHRRLSPKKGNAVKKHRSKSSKLAQRMLPTTSFESRAFPNFQWMRCFPFE